MREGQASRTAQYMALFRAVESTRPRDERLFDDPLARAFLRWPLSAVAWLATVPGLGRALPTIIDRRVPGSRSSGVARTRFIDDADRHANAAQFGGIHVQQHLEFLQWQPADAVTHD